MKYFPKPKVNIIIPPIEWIKIQVKNDFLSYAK